MSSESDLFFKKLDSKSDVPLYIQLVKLIKGQIEDGLLAVGDMIPSELEICENFDISRSTVRQALLVLEKDGLLVRERGRGTFVSKPKINHGLSNIYDFGAELRSIGIDLKTKVMAFERIDSPSVDLTRRLGLKKGEGIYKIVRLRMAEADPIILETMFVPVKYNPKLTRERIESGSLHKKFFDYSGIVPFKAVETYKCTVIDKNEAALMKCRAGSSAFFIQRVSRGEDGEIFEISVMLLRGDKCKYEIEMDQDGVTVRRRFDI